MATIEKIILPKERRFYVAFNASGKTLYLHALDPIEQPAREQWLRSIETSFLREDVALIEVWEVQGPGQGGPIESFTWRHPDLHYAPCECGCDTRVLTTMSHARCEHCQKLRCKEHGKFHYKSRKSLCLDCYAAAEEARK